MRRTTRSIAVAVLALTAPFAALGCSAADSSPADSKPAAEEPAVSETLEFRDGWASARDEMSGVFGELVNDGADDLELVGAESPAAGTVELHETVTSGAEPEMRALEGSLEVPAGESLRFEPGGTHIMLMDLVEPLLAGDEVPVTLRFADGSELEVSVLVKDTAGAQENYGGGKDDEHAGHDEHSEH